MKASKLLNKKNQKTEQKAEQSYRFLCHYLDLLKKKGDKKLLAFSSSLDDQKIVESVVINAAACLEQSSNVLCVVSDFSVNEESSQSHHVIRENPEVILKNIQQYGKDYDLVLMVLPPIHLWAVSLSCAEEADELFLVEKYGCSRYKDMEKTISILSQNEIKTSGIIAAF